MLQIKLPQQTNDLVYAGLACRTMAAVLVDGVRRDGSGTAPDRGAAGSVGDVHLLAEQLSDQPANYLHLQQIFA